MKFLKYILLSAMFFAGCTTEPPVTTTGTGTGTEEPPPIDIPEPDACTVLREQFAAGAQARWEKPGKFEYKLFFNDDDATELSLMEGDVWIRTCTSSSWPTIEVVSGMWSVDGVSSYIDRADDVEGEQIVVVLCETDTAGIFVWLSSGRVLFFHDGRVMDVARFVFEKALNPTLSRDIICTVSAGKITGGLDPRTTEFGLVATTVSRDELLYGGRPLAGMIDYTVDKTIYHGATPYVVSLVRTGSIPKLTISTGANYSHSYIDRDTYRSGTLKVDDADLMFASVDSETMGAEIKGRGNSTWTSGNAKRSYKLRLTDKHPLLGMSNSRHFVLLATYADRTMLRNSLAYRLSELAGMMWAPRWVPVELYLDGSFRGMYMLVEHVRQAKERIDIGIVGEAETDGGYLFCIDYKDTQEQGAVGWVQRPTDTASSYNQMVFAFNDPEAPTQAQFDHARARIAEVETAIYKTTSTDYLNYIDAESFIHYFFVQELSKNCDGNMRLSTYIALQGTAAGGKLFFPCVWDFDLAFGNQGESTSGWFIRDSQWLRVLFKNDDFCRRVKEEWAVFYPRLAVIEGEARRWGEMTATAHARNFTSAGWGTASVNQTTEIDKMLNYLRTRAEWMDAQIKAGAHKYTGSLN